MAYALMFLAAFTAEVTGAVWTMAVAHNRTALAVVTSAMNATLRWGLLLYLVYEIHLFPAAIAGEVAGTVVALRIAGKRLVKGGA